MFRFGLIAWLLIASSSAVARDEPSAAATDVLEEGLRLASTMSAPKTPCTMAAGQWPGLTVERGRVVAAEMLGEIGGYAREAGVTGGLGGELRVVTSDRDYDPKTGEKAIDGTLRAAITAGPGAPRWIVFALPPGAVITLKDPLRLPDNVTLDGSCSDVTLEAPSQIGLVYIFGKRNVVISRLSFRKSDYAFEDPDGKQVTCVRLNGLVDAVAIMHSDLSQCGDGTIDITTSPGAPVPELARITIGYNRFSAHNKVMLFGTFTCGPTGNDDEPCDSKELEHNRNSAPRLRLTLNNNLFYRTSQRHPRVFGRVMAHIVGNVIAFDGYGTFVSNGARALIEHNVYLSTGPRNSGRNMAVWTTTTPGATRMPWDVEGFIRTRQNRSGEQAIITENEPQLVNDPAYREDMKVPRFNELSLLQVIGCVAARAGKQGAAAWATPCR